MNKERQHLFKAVGEGSLEQKEKRIDKIVKYQNDHMVTISEEMTGQIIALNQLEKTKSEIILISQMNKIADDMIRGLKIEKEDVKFHYIKSENIHILKDNDYDSIVNSNSYAVADSLHRGILIKESAARKDPIVFGNIILHELLHLKGHVFIDVDKEGKSSLIKWGVSLDNSVKKESNDNNTGKFVGLEEAVISYTQGILGKEILNLPMFEKERERMKGFSAIKNKVEISKRMSREASDIYWVSEDGLKAEDLDYPAHRKLLSYIMGDIANQYPEKYKNKEDVFKEFLRAHFSGNLSILEKITEGTFGKGSFKALGDMAGDKESAEGVLERLRGMRERSGMRRGTRPLRGQYPDWIF